ncbi:MAG TPA: radical SAM protein, partial [Candidatus Angelobacter sp.]|nr:radical SAM protein [Candidatus Angelobacter sp.]
MRATYREEPCRTALNRVRGMGFRWSLNPYTGCVHRCAFCYVRGFERRADRPADERYGSSVRVKVNVVEVLRSELRRRTWKRETVAIGAATDPYQPAEGRYRLTRGCLAALADSRTPISLITRGPLVVRDRDVLAHASRRANVTVSISIATLDDSVSSRLEPGVAPPRQRLRASAELSEVGVAAGVALAPVLPGLTDAPREMAAVLRAAREAGATHAWSNVL